MRRRAAINCPPRPSDLEISKMNPGDLYGKALHPIWEKICPYDGPKKFRSTVASVSRAQGLLIAAHWCQSEICNGGFHQFFWNSTGVMAPEAVRGFKMLKMPGAARAVAEAMRMLGRKFPRARGARKRALKRLDRPLSPREQWESPFDTLDSRFYKSAGIHGFEIQADRFVRGHLRLFFAP